MGSFAVGDVILIAFPYANFKQFKIRPAVVVANAEFDNLIVCQVTSQRATSKRAVKMDDSSFSNGTLRIVSYARPDKLFTIEQTVVQKKVAKLNTSTQKLLSGRIRALFG
jgi:mRNA interferase MazF